MNGKRPYTHILKNLFHEQAEEIIPLLWPGYRVEEVLDVEMPELHSTPIEGPPSAMAKGLAELALPGAEVVREFKTEWIEHSGRFERAYRVQVPEMDKPTVLIVEFQTEREDEKLPRRFLSNYATVLRKTAEQVDAEEEEKGKTQKKRKKGKDSHAKQDYYVLPEVLCPFPSAVPAHIRDERGGKVMMAFNFMVLGLWEKDARELLNTHVSASYFLLPVMKNADATLLGLAIEELAQRFRNDLKELGRHLTGLALMLEWSEVMPEEEKLGAREHLKRFRHLMKDDTGDE